MAASQGNLRNEIVHTLTSTFCSGSDQPRVIVQVDHRDGCGALVDIWVGSTDFEGLNTLKRHRLVNAALKTQIPDIHALTIRAWTPQEWSEKEKPVPENY